MKILNKESGILGVSELSSDMRDIENAVNEGNEAAIRTNNLFIYRVKKYIGAYAAAMGGVDCIVFTAGIGENNPDLRADILDDMEYMGVKIDRKSNDSKADLVQISTPDSKVACYSIATDEELMIARDTIEIVG